MKRFILDVRFTLTVMTYIACATGVALVIDHQYLTINAIGH